MISRRLLARTAIAVMAVVTAGAGIHQAIARTLPDTPPVPGTPAPVHKLYDSGISFGPSDGPATINAFDNGGSPDVEALVGQLNAANGAVPHVNAGVYCQNPQNGPSCWLPGSFVAVDGAQIPNYVLYSNFLTVTQGTKLTLADVPSQRAAVALSVLHNLEYREGVQARLEPSDTDVNTFAHQQLAAYYANVAAAKRAGVVPDGSTPDAYFLSSSMLSTYKRMMTIGHERAAILATHAHPDYNATPAFAAWLTEVQSHHRITVTGIPAFDLATALPENM
jgi:hypothetical protein